MQSELKPCPFCSEQCATLVIDQGDKWAHYEPSCLEVRTGYDLSDDAAWRAEAITAWNTRASDAEITRLTEALRAAEEREKGLREALVQHNDRLRSAAEVAARDGRETNWLSFRGRVRYTLAEYHELVREARAALKGPSHD